MDEDKENVKPKKKKKDKEGKEKEKKHKEKKEKSPKEKKPKEPPPKPRWVPPIKQVEFVPPPPKEKTLCEILKEEKIDPRKRYARAAKKPEHT